MKQTIISLIILTLLFGACTSVPDDPTDFLEAPFFGMIYDGHNTGVPAAQIILEEEVIAETDINGRFIIPKLEKGSYEFTIEKEGFETKTLTVDFLNKSNILYISLRSVIDYTQEADQFIQQGNYSKAFEAITKGLAISPENAPLRYLQAIYYFKISDFMASKAVLEILASEFPFDPPIFLLLLDIAIAQPNMSTEIIEFVFAYPAIVHNDRVKERLAIIDTRG
jgi:tetratricopeptide (TPR) repeat protein